VLLVIGEVQPNEGSVAVDAAFDNEIANLLGDLDAVGDQNSLVSWDDEVQLHGFTVLSSSRLDHFSFRDALSGGEHEHENGVELVGVSAESRAELLFFNKVEELGIPIGVGMPEKKPMLSVLVDAGLAESLSYHVENILWKVSLCCESRLGLQSIRDIAQFSSDEIQSLDALVRLDDVGPRAQRGGDNGKLVKELGAVDEGLTQDVHLREDRLGRFHGLGRARKEVIGMTNDISNLGELVGGLNDLDDGRRRCAGACDL